MIKLLQSHQRRIVTIGIVLLITVIGMYLRFDLRAKRELWTDEIAQIKPMEESLSATIKSARWFVQLPGDYLLVYPFYRLFGENKWGLAIPHILITIFGFYLLYILCNKYFKTLWAYIITFSIAAFNQTLILHAFEIHPYSVLVTLSIAAFLVMQYIVEKESLSLAKRFFTAIFIFIALLFHFYGTLILFFSYIFHLLFSRKEKTVPDVFLEHLKYYSIVIIIALPIWCYFVFARDMSFMYYDPFEYIHKGIIPIFKGVFGNLIGRRVLYLLLPGIPISFLIPHRERLKQVMFFVILVIAPISLTLLLCVTFKYWFIQKAFIWVMPLFAFLVGWSWDSIIIYFREMLRQETKST